MYSPSMVTADTHYRIRAADHFDLDNLERRVQEGLISKSVDPDTGLMLYNYTPEAQYSNTWDREIAASRGMVLTSDGYIQSRPLNKFFNLDQHGDGVIPPLPIEPFDVYEKVDGSMIAASSFGDIVLLTTRGSFKSDQAVAAAALWNDRFSDVRIPDGETWCFEYVAPWNRIVVPYAEENLILLACLSNKTGVDCQDVEDANWPGTKVRRFDGLDLSTIRAALPNLPHDEEGYVLRFKSGIRVKAKGNAYLQMHRIATGLSARTVWEALTNGTFDELIEAVPDEFHPWIRQVAYDLDAQYDVILLAAKDDLFKARVYARRIAPKGSDYTRKGFACYTMAYATYPGLTFGLEDGKDISDKIWGMIKPTRTLAMILEDDV